MEQKIVILKLNGGKVIPTLPKNMQDEKKRPLQSEFKEGTRDLIRGFSPELERVILPPLIGLQANEVNFAAKAKEFWADFSVEPDEDGITLNITTEKKVIKSSGSDDVEIDYPVNPDDYMVYEMARQSTRVASSPEDMANLSLFDFYLVDLAKQKEQEVSDFETIEKADMVYSKLINPDSITENTDKINWVVELLRDKGESMDVESAPMLDKKMMLRKLKDTNPLKFVSTVEDKSLATKALILKLQSHGVITKEGNEFFDGEVNIGSGKTAVAWFTKAENSAKVLALNARLKQAIELKRN